MEKPWVGRGWRLLVFLLLGFCADPVLLRADEPSIDAKSSDVLAAACAFYTGLQSFQADGAATTKTEMTGVRQEVDETFAVAMARPASFLFVKKSGLDSGSALVSNGKTVAAYVALQKEYLTAPAPADLSGLLTPGTVLTYGRVLVNTDVFKAFLAKYPFGAIANRRVTGVYAGAEKIGDADTDHLQLTGMGAVTDLWFATGSSPFLLQFRWTLNRPSGKSEATYAFSNWRSNAALPPEQFVFSPPPDAVLVTNFSMPGQQEEVPAWLKKASP